MIDARVLLVVLAAAPRSSLADERAEANAERTIIIGIGGATEVELADGSLHGGANIMAEWEVIESRLEIEFDVSVLAANGALEVPVDLLAKKLFSLSPHSELMIGGGPEIVHVTGPNNGTHLGIEFALDYMFWTSRCCGLWLEPSYEIVVHEGASHALAGTGGVIVGW